ncbi:MAG: hypothetical protein QXR19_16955 [Candidatus Jordarchaeaceae archaeon]
MAELKIGTSRLSKHQEIIKQSVEKGLVKFAVIRQMDDGRVVLEHLSQSNEKGNNRDSENSKASN